MNYGFLRAEMYRTPFLPRLTGSVASTLVPLNSAGDSCGSQDPLGLSSLLFWSLG